MPTSPASDAVDPAVARPATHLEVNDLAVGYGSSLIVTGVSITVGQGETVAIIGPNGSGKSTLLKAITGELRPESGTVRLGGVNITKLRRDQLVRRGVRLVPQEDVVFNALTVRENLQMGGYLLKRSEVPAAVDRVLDTFPVLKALQKSHAGRLSGGERKLVAIGRVLMGDPNLVVLDEPSASLSPIASEALLSEHVPALTISGAAVLLVEQRAVQALQISHWAYVMVAGRIAVEGSSESVLARGDIGELFLGRRAGSDHAGGDHTDGDHAGDANASVTE